MKKKITHLLVDLDGTLVQGDGLKMRFEFIYRTITNWQLRKGVLLPLQAFHEMRLAAESAPNGLTNDIKMIRAFAKVTQLTESEARAVLERSVHEVFPTMKKHFSPVAGAKQFMGWAEKHYPLILATNPIWNPEAVELRVKWAGLELNSFRSFTHAQRMHACKPRLEYYQELLQQESLDPQTCLLIGNDRRKDLPASQIGIRVFLVLPKQNHEKPNYEAVRFSTIAAPSWKGTYAGLRKLLESSEGLES